MGAFLVLAAALKLFVMNEDLSVSLSKAGRALPVKAILVEKRCSTERLGT